MNDASAQPARAYPLAGVTVIDLGQIYNGPYCTFMMAMAGANIIKIEARGGENLRRRGVVGGAALPFAMLNSNKTFATLNLKTERGRELLRAMVKRGDVLVENFAPGAMERLGVGYDKLREVNPRLIYGSGSGLFTRSLAADYGSKGIRANIVCPGLIDTPMANWITEDMPALKAWEKRLPAQRIGTVEDIANAVSFLASDASSYIHGESMLVDGGGLA